MDLFKTLHNPDAKVGSSAFDMSAKHVFSSQAGQCVPCYVLDTVPGDKFEIDLAAMMRSNTLDTAAFIRGKFNYDFFFVPYMQVWHRFLDFVSQRNDIHTAYVKNQNCVSTPTISLRQLIRSIINASINSGSSYVYRYHGRPPYYDMLKLLDQLGYGNYIFLLSEADSRHWDEDDVELTAWLVQLFGGSVESASDDGNIFINPFRLAAYQHIWYDFYRNKYFDTESDDMNLRYQEYFNFDDIDTSSVANSRMSFGSSLLSREANRIFNLCSLRWCQWKKDIYTSCMPSQQFGVVSAVDLVSDSPLSLSSGAYPNSGYFLTSASNGKIAISTASVNGTNVQPSGVEFISFNSNFDILSLRRAEALQKWKEATLRAGNMNDNNQRAHFGVTPYYYEDNEVNFLGSFDGSFQVNPVEATAQTGSGSNQSVGNLAATGTAVVQGNKLHFDCRDYGILMCICRFVPESEYVSNGLEKANSRFEPFDYYNPEFANIGLEAVPLIEQELSSYISNKNFVLGYAPRNYDYKQMVDKVYGLFGSYLGYDGVRNILSFANWVSPRRDNLVSAPNTPHIAQYRNRSSFYVSPNILDSVFGVSAAANPNRDQFIHNVYFDVKAIRKMPILGLPQF